MATTEPLLDSASKDTTVSKDQSSLNVESSSSIVSTEKKRDLSFSPEVQSPLKIERHERKQDLSLITRTLPRLPAEYRSAKNKAIQQGISNRRKTYMNVKCSNWTPGNSADLIAAEFYALNLWRKNVWYNNFTIGSQTLESRMDFVISQPLVIHGRYRKPHLVAFEYNNTDHSYNSSTVILKGITFLAFEAPMDPPTVRAMRELVHNHKVDILVRLTAEKETVKEPGSDTVKEILKCINYWMDIC